MTRVALILVLLLAISLGIMTVTEISIQHDLTYPENAGISTAWRIARGEAAYTDWRRWPHQFTPYGPAFYYPVGWMMRVLAGNQLSFGYYLLGRLISVLSIAGIGVVTGLLIRRISGWGLWAGLLPFGLMGLWPDLYAFVASFRPDAPAVFWSMTAVLIAAGGLQSRVRRMLTCSCLMLSMSYKFSSIAAPVVIAWIAWRTLNAPIVFLWASVFVTGTLAWILTMNNVTDGFFLLNAVYGQTMGFSVPVLTLFPPIHLLGPFATLAVLGGVCVTGITLWKPTRTSEPDIGVRAIGLYLALSPPIALLQMFKVGADLNYLLEPLSLTGVAIAARSAAATPSIAIWSRASASTKGFIAGAFALLTISIIWNNAQLILRYYRITQSGDTQHFLRNAPAGSLLMDRAFLHSSPSVHALPDPFHYAVMLRRGKMPEEPLRKRLEARSFPVISMSPVATHAFLINNGDTGLPGLLRGNYRLTASRAGVDIWERIAPAGQ